MLLGGESILQRVLLVAGGLKLGHVSSECLILFLECRNIVRQRRNLRTLRLHGALVRRFPHRNLVLRLCLHRRLKLLHELGCGFRLFRRELLRRVGILPKSCDFLLLFRVQSLAYSTFDLAFNLSVHLSASAFETFHRLDFNAFNLNTERHIFITHAVDCRSQRALQLLLIHHHLIEQHRQRLVPSFKRLRLVACHLQLSHRVNLAHRALLPRLVHRVGIHGHPGRRLRRFLARTSRGAPTSPASHSPRRHLSVCFRPIARSDRARAVQFHFAHHVSPSRACSRREHASLARTASKKAHNTRFG